MASLLIMAGADVNAAKEDGHTPITVALLQVRALMPVNTSITFHALFFFILGIHHRVALHCVALHFLVQHSVIVAILPSA